jgi:Na+-driven multidrug efflux pump
VALGVIFALAGAVGPIVGQNAGLGQMERVRRTVWGAVVFATMVLSLVMLV